MKSILALMFTATLAASPLAMVPANAVAAPHPRVTPLDCRALAAKIGASNVWQARFQGMRRANGPLKFYERTFAIGCFRTNSACVDWLYWEQSDWPYQNTAGRCRKGMPYGS